MISGCRRGVEETRAHLELLTAYNDSFYRRFGSTFLAYIQGSSSLRVFLTLGYETETSVTNFHFTLHEIPKEHRSKTLH